jgi:hypothetical protein
MRMAEETLRASRSAAAVAISLVPRRAGFQRDLSRPLERRLQPLFYA